MTFGNGVDFGEFNDFDGNTTLIFIEGAWIIVGIPLKTEPVDPVPRGC